mgnify:CR=1 FL=1
MKPRDRGKVPGSPDEWIGHAKSDLRIAHMAADDELVLRSQACFHAQQAAEKAIKAAMLRQGMRFPLTHDIEELLEIAESNGMAFPEDVAEAGNLTPYAVEARYPGCWYEITEEDLKEAIRLAEITVKWADEMIQKP